MLPSPLLLLGSNSGQPSQGFVTALQIKSCVEKSLPQLSLVRFSDAQSMRLVVAANVSEFALFQAISQPQEAVRGSSEKI